MSLPTQCCKCESKAKVWNRPFDDSWAGWCDKCWMLVWLPAYKMLEDNAAMSSKLPERWKQ